MCHGPVRVFQLPLRALVDVLGVRARLGAGDQGEPIAAAVVASTTTGLYRNALGKVSAKVFRVNDDPCDASFRRPPELQHGPVGQGRVEQLAALFWPPGSRAGPGVARFPTRRPCPS